MKRISGRHDRRGLVLSSALVLLAGAAISQRSVASDDAAAEPKDQTPMTEKPFAIIEAPSILGLFPKGVEKLPAALLNAGLAERLRATRFGRVAAPAYDPKRDPQSQLLNAPGIASYSVALADMIGRAIDTGTVPVVLGGDCSILLGTSLALRRRGRFGLLFLDGHADFYQPAAEPNGEVASMDLAIVTGHGPEILARLDGHRPLIDEIDVVVLGRRDSKEAAEYGSQRIEDTAIELIELETVRRDGAETSVRKAMVRLTRPGLEGFWVHLDADVLDDAIMPAVDYRMPGGLSFEELSTVLRVARASGKLVGIEVTIFNPSLDRHGQIARGLVDALVQGLST